MKALPLFFISILFTSCMDVTIPDFKSNDKLPEDEKGEEVGDVVGDEVGDEEDESPADNTYPLITSATISNEFLPYVSLFIFYGNMFGKDLNYSNLIISLESDMGAVAGQCSSINNNQNKLIKINNDMWPNLSQVYREQLIFHEASHCLLDRSHKGNDFYNPQSIMNVSLFPDYIYTQRYNEFIYELFERPVSDHEFIFGELTPHE